MAEKEYVDKETVLKHFDEVMNNEFCDADFKKAALGFSIYVSRLAAADVAPIRHGRWETISDSDMSKTVMCSVCNKMFYFTKKRAQLNIDKMPHCPNCGAKMGGEIK